MAAKKVYDALATMGKYKDKQSGKEKKRYAKVGVVFENGGKLSLKLDMVPAGPDWSGWISLFPVDDPKPPPPFPPMPGGEPEGTPF